MRYDPEQGRVIYQPVTIEPREITPRIIREDQRYGRARDRDSEPSMAEIRNYTMNFAVAHDIDLRRC